MRYKHKSNKEKRVEKATMDYIQNEVLKIFKAAIYEQQNVLEAIVATKIKVQWKETKSKNVPNKVPSK